MAYFRCSTGSASSGDGVALVVQCDANFAGSVITADNGEDTFTETCPSASPYTVRFEGIPTGTYTISGVSQGQTFTTQFTVLDYETTLNATPDGATVLPVNDIQIWLHCANIWDKNYTTLDEVLADNTTLLALISDHNAVDYMVRSTDFIGQNYNLVPIMTSDTTPSGEAFASSVYSGHPAYYAFDRVDSLNNSWYSSLAAIQQYIGYKFTNPTRIIKLSYTSGQYMVGKGDSILQGSNDGTTWTNITNITHAYGGTTVTFENNNKHLYYRLLFTDISTTEKVIFTLQFWGAPGVVDNQTAMGYIGNNDYCADTLLADATWCEAICNSTYFESVLNVKVPTMTSATTPSGTVSTVGILYPQAQPYNLFDGITNDDQTSVGILPNDGGVIYDFGYEVLVKKFGAIYGKENILTNDMNFLLYGSNDGTSYTQIGTLAFNHSNASWQFVALPNSSTPYRYFKVMADGNNYSNRYAYATEYQFYGRA